MRYESTQTIGSSEGSYFSTSLGALNGCGDLSPRTMGLKHAGPTRLSEPVPSGGWLLWESRACLLWSSEWRRSCGCCARHCYTLSMCCRASIGSPFAATARRIGRGSLVKCTGAVSRSWGSGGGQFWLLATVLSAAGRAEEAARLEDVRK